MIYHWTSTWWWGVSWVEISKQGGPLLEKSGNLTLAREVRETVLAVLCCCSCDSYKINSEYCWLIEWLIERWYAQDGLQCHNISQGVGLSVYLSVCGLININFCVRNTWKSQGIWWLESGHPVNTHMRHDESTLCWTETDWDNLAGVHHIMRFGQWRGKPEALLLKAIKFGLVKCAAVMILYDSYTNHAKVPAITDNLILVY